jgi:hypothetical protein
MLQNGDTILAKHYVKFQTPPHIARGAIHSLSGQAPRISQTHRHMCAAIDAMPGGTQPDRPIGRAPAGASAWLEGMCRKLLAWVGCSAATDAGEARRQQVLRLARQHGYVCLDVDGGSPIEMLLLRRGERVIVLSERAARTPHYRVQMLLEAADASAAWTVGLTAGGEPVYEVVVAETALA